MKNIIKTLIVMLTSISLFGSANAGELTVNGTAKATYNILSGKTNTGKGLGITNELNFTAAGELDNGYTWSYSMELDPDSGPAVSGGEGVTENDDTKLTMTAPWGTVGVFISEGGLDVEDAASQSVYGRPTDIGDPSSGTGDNYTIDAYNNVQYHMPADMLPFGIVGKIAYAPDLDADKNSGNAKGNTIGESATSLGRSATELQVKAAPIDGLAIGASYFEFDGAGAAGTTNSADPMSGAYYATYASGPFGIGYSKAYKQPLNTNTAGDSTTQVDRYEQTNYSVAYAASDDLSISYEVEEDTRFLNNAGTSVDQESTSIQVAYTMGGMTLAVAHGNYENIGWTEGEEQDQTLFAVTMAF